MCYDLCQLCTIDIYYKVTQMAALVIISSAIYFVLLLIDILWRQLPGIYIITCKHLIRIIFMLFTSNKM